jgi:hypothetical protein
MAQNQRRMLYAKIWTSEQFSKLSDRAKLLYIGTLTLSDDDGRLIANPAYLRGQIFTYDDISIGDVLNIRKEVEDTKLISVYKVNEKEYIEHPNWLKYQVIRGDLYHPSSLPNRNGTVTDTIPKRDTSKDKISKDKIRGCGGKKEEVLPINIKKLFMYYYDQDVKQARKNNYKNKITPEAKSMLIAVALLWEKMAKEELNEKEVPMKNIYYPIRKCWDNNPEWKYNNFKDLFTHFLKSKIPQEDKISFDLCLSEKYVAKYKIAGKNKKQSFAGIANELTL